MKRLLILSLGLLALSTVAPAPTFAAFGLNNLQLAFENEDGSAVSRAGVHPFAVSTALGTNSREDPGLGLIPEGAVKDLTIQLPPGLVGNPTAVAPCSNADFTKIIDGGTSCPDAAAIGTVELTVGFEEPEFYRVALYNLEPPPGVVAKVGFVVLGVPVTVDLGVNPNPPYNIIALSTNVSQAIRFYGVKVSVWGNPASPVHNQNRGGCFTSPAEDTCPVVLPERPFLTAPRSCSGALQGSFETDSWQEPGSWLIYPVQAGGLFGCAGLPFGPRISSRPTTTAGSSPSGLEFNLDVEDEGLTSATGTAGSDIKTAEVTLPEGVTVNPSVAGGLVSCTEADLARETAFSEPGEGCPQASKIGEVEVETPLLEGRILRGQVYVAAQEENPFDSLVALYMVIENPQLGIIVKLPGRVELDEETGQVRTIFGEAGFEIPQFPFSHLRLRFREGPRSPLITPAACGRYQTTATFTPWANPTSPYTTQASFNISTGPDGSSCPSQGLPSFSPDFGGGSIDNAAGAFSPYYMRITRRDGEQNLARFSGTLPPGVVGKIAGIAKCPDAAIATAGRAPGRVELMFPSCPASSKVGRTLSGAGAGSALTWVPGSLYLAGPFGGDPLSIVAITPAVAGPFDAGTVVVREGLDLDPESGIVKVDGSASSRIPHILEGIPLSLRDLRVFADRPDFTLNPTSCDELHSGATLFGSGARVLDPADDVPVVLSARYQASSCASLRFKQKVMLSLEGGTRRGTFPALTAKLAYPAGAGYANLAKAVVTLPHAMFLEQAHIRTICTRVQFSAGSCPAKSVYGHARAVTPLLAEPLEGPVYLRANGNERKLPDLVVALHGIFDINLVGYIDSVNQRLRTRFLNAPDAPVSSFTLKMQGGASGLIVNSKDLCGRKVRVTEKLTAHNGAQLDHRPPLEVVGCGGGNRRKN